jgi:hypothetical protein
MTDFQEPLWTNNVNAWPKSFALTVHMSSLGARMDASMHKAHAQTQTLAHTRTLKHTTRYDST